MVIPAFRPARLHSSALQEEVYDILTEGAKTKHVFATKVSLKQRYNALKGRALLQMNDRSSRSHSVFSIHLSGRVRNKVTKGFIFGRSPRLTFFSPLAVVSSCGSRGLRANQEGAARVASDLSF